MCPGSQGWRRNRLGGGYRPADLSTYFSGLDVPPPAVTAVSVDHATNSPTGDGDGPDGEVMLDIEVVGAIAPGARVAVYFAPNTDAGFLDATVPLESLYHTALDQARRLAVLPDPAFRNTKDNERGAIIRFIRETLAADMAKLIGPR